MEIKLQKHYIKFIEKYQTGFLIELENFINPEIILRDIKNNSDIDIRDIQIQYRMDFDNEVHISLYARDIDRVDF